jgi:NhaP-type Na+/H+ and K+/H+ antiporter
MRVLRLIARRLRFATRAFAAILTGHHEAVAYAILLMIGGADMVAVYVALIVAGSRTYAQVPALLREQVKAALIAVDLGEMAV